MGMIKIVTPDSWNFQEPIVTQVKYGQDGRLGSNDRQSMIKRAGHFFVQAAKDIDFHPGEVPAHIIALGAEEFWGPNRRGDGFRKKACQTRCKTFEKQAMFYRDHKNNRRNDPHFGRVKLAFYNPEMRRVELMVGLYRTKEASDLTGGRIADREIEALESGRDFPTSMAATVSHDICNACKKVAKTPREYCDEFTCKRGGCKNNLGRAYEDGFIQSVDNPDPTWIDISGVWKGADRICFGSKADYIKAASDAGVPLGAADLANAIGLTYDPDLLSLRIPGTPLPKTETSQHFLKQAYASSKGFEAEQKAAWSRFRFNPGFSHSTKASLFSFAKHAMVLPPEKYAEEILGLPIHESTQLRNHVGRCFEDVISQNRKEELVISSPLYQFVDHVKVADLDIMANTYKELLSFSDQSCDARYKLACIRSYNPRTSRDTVNKPSETIKKAAESYIGYILNVLPTVAACSGYSAALNVLDYLDNL